MAKPDNAGAGATDYMHLFGLVALGHMWARIAVASHERIAAGDAHAEVLKADLCSAAPSWSGRCRRPALRLARITAGAETLMAIPAEAF